MGSVDRFEPAIPPAYPVDEAGAIRHLPFHTEHVPVVHHQYDWCLDSVDAAQHPGLRQHKNLFPAQRNIRRTETDGTT